MKRRNIDVPATSARTIPDEAPETTQEPPRDGNVEPAAPPGTAELAADSVGDTNSATPKALVDPAEVRRAFETFVVEPGQVTEIRAVLKGKGVLSGYFDSLEAAVEAATQVAELPVVKGVYFTPNPVDPALLSRAHNRMRSRQESKPTTSDVDIVRRTWLLVDLDPQRATDVSSSDAEHETALERARRVRDSLASAYGFPSPVLADSGNGAHLVFQVELENNEADASLAERALKALDHLFSDGAVKVDVTTYNAARIWKLYGTISRKGDDTPERPHRISRILEVPPLEPVPREALERLVSVLPEPKAWRREERLGGIKDIRAWLEAWIEKHRIPVLPGSPQAIAGGRLLYKLESCPWNAEHGVGDAWIILHPGNIIGARCWHNGCAGKGWRDLRQHYEPGCYDRAERRQGAGGEGASSEPPDLSVLDDLAERCVEDVAVLDDDAVLEALAYLRATQPGAYEAKVKELKASGVRLRSFEPRVHRRSRKYASNSGGPAPTVNEAEMDWQSACRGYFVKRNCFYRIKIVKVQGEDVEVPVQISNFQAKVAEDVTRDNGVEQVKTFAMDGTLVNGRTLARSEIPASEFSGLAWIPQQWGPEPAVLPGQTSYAAYAVQLRSGEVPRKIIYTHIGFSRTGSGLIYLHSAGALGAEGIEVDVAGDGLQRYILPTDVGDPVAAMKLSLEFLSVGSPVVSYMAWAIPWRAILCEFLPCTVMPHWVGGSGRLKSSLAAAVLAHHGNFRTKEDLPARWEFTDNILEKGSFLAKDVPFPIDDLNPETTRIRREELERRFSRIAASVGNMTGRRRMTSTLQTRLEYWPRGLVISTGEYTPNLASSRLARIFPVNFDDGAVDPARLAALQAKLELLPYATRAFIECIRRDEAGERAAIKERFEEARANARDLRSSHSRIPENIAHLYIGLDRGLRFAVEIGALTEAEAEEHARRGWEVFCTAAQEHGIVIEEERPEASFCAAIEEALAQGQAWLLHRETSVLVSGDAGVGSTKLGWADDNGVYLLPKATYRFVAARLEYRGGLQVSERALHKMLEEAGVLQRSTSEPKRLTPNFWCGDSMQRVLWLRRDALTLPPPGRSDTHCRACGIPLNRIEGQRCERCRWTICSCGACGCGVGGAARGWA